MSRVKSGVTSRKRRKKVLKMSKGYRLGRKNLYRHVTEQVDKSLQYAYRDRRKRKSIFRSLWVVRVNAAARLSGISYSKLMNGLKKAGISIDRKILADLAVYDMGTFNQLVELAKKQLKFSDLDLSSPSTSSSSVLSKSDGNIVS